MLSRRTTAAWVLFPLLGAHAILAAPRTDDGGPITGAPSPDPDLYGGAEGPDKSTEEPRANFPGRIFLVTRKQDDPMSGVVAIDPNSGVVRKIIEDNFQGTRVSPDGRFVASTGITACGRASKERGIWIYDTLSERKPLKVFDGVSVPSGWSRDGTEILVSSSTPPRMEFVTWRVKVDGTGKQRLPVPTTEMVSDWSPDGRWLLSWSIRKKPEMPYYLVSSELEGSDAVHHSHIEIVDLEGRSLRTIPLPLDSTGPWLVGWK